MQACRQAEGQVTKQNARVGKLFDKFVVVQAHACAHLVASRHTRARGRPSCPWPPTRRQRRARVRCMRRYTSSTHCLLQSRHLRVHVHWFRRRSQGRVEKSSVKHQKQSTDNCAWQEVRHALSKLHRRRMAQWCVGVNACVYVCWSTATHSMRVMFRPRTVVYHTIKTDAVVTSEAHP